MRPAIHGRRAFALLLVAGLHCQLQPAAAALATAGAARTTALGTRFVAPDGWTITRRGAATVLDAPEPGSRVALVDVRAVDAGAAVALAWAAYAPTTPPLWLATAMPDDVDWVNAKRYVYDVPQREVVAIARRSGARWSVAISDLALAVADRRDRQLKALLAGLTPGR